jgi:signal transduction histidine kinase
VKKEQLYNTRWAAALALALAVMVLIWALLELRSTRRELTAALEEQARTVMALAQRGLDNAALSWEFVESGLEERLLNNARLLERADREGRLTSASLRQIALENDLHRINIFDREGRRLLSSHATVGEPPVSAPRRLLQPVLADSSDELLLGFRQRFFGAGDFFAVAKHRRGGGAIVVHADAESVLDFRRAIGAGSFIKLIAGNETIRYAVVQDSGGVLLASEGVTGMGAFTSDPFLGSALKTAIPQTRFTLYQDEEIFEIAAPARLSASGEALLRIGLSAASLHHASRAALWRIGISTLLLLLTGLLAAGALLRELRERRRTEEQRRRQEQITAMGHLASGVAHEIRNPLNAVSIIAQRLDREFEPSRDADEYRQLTGTLAAESRRINDIVTQFLQFARPAPLNLIPVRLEADRSGVTLTSHCREVREVMADGDKLTQALINLVRNSLAACTEGGHIELTCSPQGDQILLSVADDGAGIAPENIGKIFNLYFTTSEGGSGLGLSIVQQIIAQHEGSIRVESEPGRATRFTITLPAR